MKTRIISFLSAAALLAGCYEDAGELGVDTATRIALSPAQIGFTADGTTVDGKVAYVGVVQVMPFEKGRYAWRAEGDVTWAAVGETVVDETFADTWTGAVTATRMRAVEIMATPNTEYRRSGVLTVTAEDGTVATFAITQAGLKADAAIACELAKTGIEYVSGGGETVIDYTTNMGDVYDYAVSYGEPDAGQWLTWSDEGAGRVVLRAAEWTSKSDNRTAVFTIHVGTAETSEASVAIAVTQLRVDDYYYLYGASVPRYEPIAAALQMTKQEEGVYTAETCFAARGTNPVRINKDSRTLAYPCYALAADGRVAVIASAETPLPAGPEIEADGLRTLTVDFGSMTWSWERITTPNCLPDDRAAGYPAKAYVTPRGTYKTWMTRNLDWDGGDAAGAYKLGCPLVFSATNKDTGGYNSKTDPTYSYRNTALRNPAWDDTENGGQIVPDAAITAIGGRHYTFYEYLTGVPRGGLMEEYYSEWPAPYTVGREVRDAADYTILFEGITSAKLQEYAGREEEFFKEHPVSRIQIQGICPYGWHIANMQDWKDLAYAAFKQSASDFPVAEATASYHAFGGGTLANFAALLFTADWNIYNPNCKAEKISTAAADFGFNMFSQGWRLYKTGYDYGPGDNDPRMYAFIPCIGEYTAKKKAGWRIWNQSREANMRTNGGFDFGNGCGGAVRCVKNYKK